MEWSVANTKAFIEKIYERVKNGQLQGSTFKSTTWEEINKELFEMIQTNYGVDKLKSKFNRLRQMHRDFSTLLARTGVTWEMESNKVNAPDEVWDELINVTSWNFYPEYLVIILFVINKICFIFSI